MTQNREIEIKLRVPDVRELVQRLRKAGAKKIARIYESNKLFDTPAGEFRKRQAILRIRREQTAEPSSKPPGRSGHKNVRAGGLLTFKGLVEEGQSMKERYKEREEIEYRIKDARRFERVLKSIGMRPWFQYEKYRTKYRSKDGGLNIDLDETPIGNFLELEGERRAIDRMARTLGYSSRDYVTESYLELYRAECARKGVKVANMVFETKKKR